LSRLVAMLGIGESVMPAIKITSSLSNDSLTG
jgi:hypothetical protein